MKRKGSALVELALVLVAVGPILAGVAKIVGEAVYLYQIREALHAGAVAASEFPLTGTRTAVREAVVRAVGVHAPAIKPDRVLVELAANQVRVGVIGHPATVVLPRTGPMPVNTRTEPETGSASRSAFR